MIPSPSSSVTTNNHGKNKALYTQNMFYDKLVRKYVGMKILYMNIIVRSLCSDNNILTFHVDSSRKASTVIIS